MRRNLSPLRLFLTVALTVAATKPPQALTELSDESLSDVQGAGLAIAAHDFSFQAAPTSYIWIVGTSTSLSAWERGDLFYYGTSWTGGQTGPGTGTSFFKPGGGDDSQCNQADTVGCPIGTQGVPSFASVLNPYIFRVFEYEGFDYQGSYRSGTNMPSVLELIGPSKTSNWRWAFWGEIEVDRGGTSNPGLLQSQTIINGSPTAGGKPSVIRYVRTQQGTFADPSQDGSFGIIYESALSGDFRFSVGQKGTSKDLQGWVPEFDNNEGLYFRDVEAFIPVGRMHYQTIQLDTSGSSGDFEIALTPIPKNPNIYSEFYCGSLTGDCGPTVTESVDFFGNSVEAIASPNTETQGYIYWGDFTDVGNFAHGNGGNGIMFVDRTGSMGAANALRNNAPMGHMGVSRIEGLRIQSMTITTLGAGVP